MMEKSYWNLSMVKRCFTWFLLDRSEKLIITIWKCKITTFYWCSITANSLLPNIWLKLFVKLSKGSNPNPQMHNSLGSCAFDIILEKLELYVAFQWKAGTLIELKGKKGWKAKENTKIKNKNLTFLPGRLLRDSSLRRWEPLFKWWRRKKHLQAINRCK